MFVPPVPPDEVERASICDEVCNAAPVITAVLFTAPAGFGKTSAMSQCYRRFVSAGIRAAWLALEPAHNNPSRLLEGLTSAIRSIGDDDDSFHSVPDALQALASHDAPYALFVDEFDCINDVAVHGVFNELLESVPLGSRLLIGSRKHLRQSLSALRRLRARGHLLEVDAEQLRFSADETHRYFQLGHHRSLPEALQFELHRKSEGWIAMLRLARVVCDRQRLDSAVIDRLGSSHALAVVLGEQVLAQQSETLREFMLHTSVLRELDASICHALWPRGDFEQIIERLDQANLLLPAQADRLQGRRYHGLLAEFLRTQLRQERPGEYVRLHLAASAAFEMHGDIASAINHAIEGGDVIHAMELLEPHLDRFLLQGRMRLLAGWFSAIGEEVIRRKPRLMAVSIWAACLTQGATRAMAMVESLDTDLRKDPDLQAHVNAQQPVLLQMLDRMDEAHPVGMRNLENLPTSSSFADSTLLNAMAFQSIVMGQPQDAPCLLDKARLALGDSTFNRMHAESIEGLLNLEQARLREATARFRIALKASPGSSYSGATGNAWAGVLYAAALYERNELVEAKRLLRIYLPVASNVGLPDHIITGYSMQARLSFIAGDVDQAFESLCDLESVGHERRLERVSSSARLERSRILLLQGNVNAAEEDVSRAALESHIWERVRRQHLPAHDVDNLEIAKLRLALARGRFGQVLDEAGTAIARSTAEGRLRRTLKLNVLRSIALHGSGDIKSAGEAMLEVLSTASNEGFMRLILDEGPAAENVVRSCSRLLQAQEPRPSPILEEYVDKLVAMLPAVAVEPTAEEALAQPAVPLTQREICILELVAQGYSNVALGEKLFVSENTVRTHLRNINVKLEAKSRTQAIAIARKLGILR